MEVTGKVIAKPQSKSGSTWKKAFIVVRYDDGQYPHDIMLSNMKQADDFERIRIGDKGTFKFDGSCREAGDRWYFDLNCWSWKIEDTYNRPF